jgi:hypothetical protein
MHIDLKLVTTLDDDERAALKALTAAVYPPEVVAVSPGRHFQWAPPDYKQIPRSARRNPLPVKRINGSLLVGHQHPAGALV